MKVQEALEKISDFLKVKEMAFFVLEKDSINVELEKSEVEAIRILMTKFEQLQKENAELKTQNETQKFKIDWCEAHTISKDMIRKKIKELKSDEEKLKQDEDYVPIYQIKSKIKVLKELLKGE